MKRGEGSRPSGPFPISNRATSLHALLPSPLPYVSHAFDASNRVSFRRRAGRPSTSPSGRHSTAPTRFASSPIRFPSFLPRLLFLRPFASFFHASSVIPPRLAWFRSSWLRSCCPVVVLHRSREKQGRIQLGFSSNPVRGSPGDVSHSVSRVSQPSGVRVRRWREPGSEDRGYGRTGFPGLPRREGVEREGEVGGAGRYPQQSSGLLVGVFWVFWVFQVLYCQ